jgi:S1-C subfamily serine protease
MDDIQLLANIESYLAGEMSPTEVAVFEALRKKTPEIDQMVVEHRLFQHQMEDYAATHNIKHTLHEVHARLLENGDVNEGGELSTKAQVVQLWNRYKRVTAIAASAGGVIALVISGLVAYFTPVVNGNQIQQLSKDIEIIKRNQQYQGSLINEVKSKIPTGVTVISGGSGFLIDAKGYIITNAHVLKGTAAVVVDSKGNEFTASIVHIDTKKDLAILKINDDEFTPLKSLPYSIGKTNADLGDEIFTLGYPRNDIVYGVGYLASKTGFNGDSLSYQIQISANPGNSGGPVLNNNGEVIGVLSTRQAQADGVAFAVKSKNIFECVNEAKEGDTILGNINIPVHSSMKGIPRKLQISKVADCVFNVKAFSKK